MNRSRFYRLLLVALLPLLASCARYYQAYPCGNTHYGYCPREPLPHRTYCRGHWPCSWQGLSSGEPAADKTVPDGKNPGETSHETGRRP